MKRTGEHSYWWSRCAARISFGILGLCVCSSSLARSYSLLPEESSVGIDAAGYFHSSSQASESFRAQVFPQVVGVFDEQGKWRFLEWGARADLMMLMTGVTEGRVRPVPLIDVPEIFLTTPRGVSAVQFKVGRKLEHWSRLDEAWDLGIWQPRYRWDYLHPEKEGLLGASFGFESTQFQALLWASPFFVPERGAPINNQEGRMDSDSRWFVPPPHSIPLFGQSTSVNYHLNLPPLGELMSHSGWSAQLRWGKRGLGPWMTLSGADKPLNQLLLSSDAYLKISETQGVFADASIYPRVGWHRLAGGEAGWVARQWDAWISAHREWPRQEALRLDWTVQQVVPATAIASQVAWNSAGGSRIELDYFQVSGGNAGDLGPLAGGGDESMYEARYPYRSAWSITEKNSIDGERFSNWSRLFFDPKHRVSVLSTEIKYHAGKRWQWGRHAPVAPPGQRSFGSRPARRL